MWKIYSKIEKFSSVITFFVRNEFKFTDSSTKALFDNLLPGDKKLFNFDVKTLNWQDFFFMYLRGLRIYLVDDPMETLPQGRRKGLILKIAHYSIITIVSFLLAWFIVLPFFSWALSLIGI